MRSGIIYKVTSPSNRIYIGQTIVSFERRRRKHCSDANDTSSRAYSAPFARAIRKYGDRLKWELLRENIPEGELDAMEREEISRYNALKNGYNCNIGGGSMRGYKHTLAVKQKLSQRMKQVWKNTIKADSIRRGMQGLAKTSVHRRKLSKALAGRRLTEEHKFKISQALVGKKNPMYGVPSPNTGKTLSEETKRKMSEAAKKRWQRQKGQL